MSNIQIESDLKEILQSIDNKLDQITTDVTELKVGQAEIKGEMKAIDERLSGQIKALDERLSGQIKALDGRLSGQIKALDTKVEQLDKRIGNSELTNRGILIGLIVAILGGAAKLLGLVGNP